jgi:ABC-2 type transport system permease protein
MPQIYNWISSVLPPRYFIVIIKNIMIKGTGFMYIWKETLILTIMAAVFIGLSIRNFRIRLG